MLSLTLELLVEDVSITLDWYRQVLGFETLFMSPEVSTPTFARIKRGTAEIMLFRRAEFAREIPSFTTPPIGGTFVLYFEVNDIHKLWDSVQTYASIIQPLHATDYGSTEFTIQDCNGYHLMFGERNQ